MIIPKEFKNLEDLEAMLLTSILGTLIALKENLISPIQANNYWLNDETVDLLADVGMDDEIICLVSDCIDIIQDETINYDLLEECIDKCKSILGDIYTNYDEVDNEYLN